MRHGLQIKEPDIDFSDSSDRDFLDFDIDDT